MASFFRFMLRVFILAALPGAVKAQLCVGSLGDPVVNITFGTPGNPDFNFTPPSAYTYTANACPNDGFYTITNATSGCFSSSWHTVPADHTGGGAFMLVNASYNPGDFFVATVNNLCPSTTYEFAAWVVNVLKSTTGIQPDLTFKVETTSGIVLNQFNTGGIAATPAPVWQQYGFFFTTTPGTQSVVLRITNNAPGGIGNDLGLDDITFRPCGPKTTSSIAGNNDQIDMCEYEQGTYFFDGTVSSGYTNPVLQWQVSTDLGGTWTDITGATTLQYQRVPTPPGKYWYRLTVAEAGNSGIAGCRISSNTLEINVHAKPVVNAGPDRILVKGNSVSLPASILAESPLRFEWSPPDGLNDVFSIQPQASPTSDKVYRLSATSGFGCVNEDRVYIKVVNGVFVPTGFTPNNDGRNDTWTIPYLDPSIGATVRVFNRYGQLVYQCTGTPVNWDGKLNGEPQPSGTYVYVISFKPGRADLKGVLTLIR